MARSTRRRRSHRGGDPELDAHTAAIGNTELKGVMNDENTKEMKSDNPNLKTLLSDQIGTALKRLKMKPSIITENKEKYVRFIDNVCLAMKTDYDRQVRDIPGKVISNRYEEISELYRDTFGNSKNTGSRFKSIFGVSSKLSPELDKALAAWKDINELHKKYPPRRELTKNEINQRINELSGQHGQFIEAFRGKGRRSRKTRKTRKH